MRSVIKETFLKLNLRDQLKNPILFLVYLGAIITSVMASLYFDKFDMLVALWLWLTVLFANFVSTLVERQVQVQLAALKWAQTQNFARKLTHSKEERVSADAIKVGDLVACEVEDIIPADGEVIEGIATVDESAITGESAPVIREGGGEWGSVTAGTRVMSDRIVIRVTSNHKSRFLSHMENLIKEAQWYQTPQEITLNNVLCLFSMLFLLAVLILKLHMDTVSFLIALLLCLMPTTVSALFRAIGIAGLNHLLHQHGIAKSSRAIEALGEIDLRTLDRNFDLSQEIKALIIFSILNTLTKYVVIILALGGKMYYSPQSAILSILIFNALMIPILAPLAIKKGSHPSRSIVQLLGSNRCLYGLIGLIVPFIGMTLIDWLIHQLHIL